MYTLYIVHRPIKIIRNVAGTISHDTAVYYNRVSRKDVDCTPHKIVHYKKNWDWVHKDSKSDEWTNFLDSGQTRYQNGLSNGLCLFRELFK